MPENMSDKPSFQNKSNEKALEPEENLVMGLWGKFTSQFQDGKSTSQFQDKYYQSLVYGFRDLKTVVLNTRLSRLDFEQVFVPLRFATKIPGNRPNPWTNSNQSQISQEIWDFIAKIPKRPAYRHLAIIAPPGSGKTTTLQHLTLTYANNAHRQYKAPKLIPILVDLRNSCDRITSEQTPLLAQLVTKQVEEGSLPGLGQSAGLEQPPANWFRDQLENGKCLVMLDGLDEVADPDQRQQVSQWVNQQMQTYPQTAFIVTYSPQAYRSTPGSQVETVLEVQPFNFNQIQQFLQGWYRQTKISSRGKQLSAQKQVEDLVERIRNNPSIASMASNPLLLTMIATLHACGSILPERRGELYSKICHVLLEVSSAQNIPIQLTTVQKQSVLQRLALGLMEQEACEFTPSDTQDLLASVAGSRLKPKEFLKHIETTTGLLVERRLGIYEFAHQSFQDYLAAGQVKELKLDQILTKNVDNPWWTETIRFWADDGDGTNLIRAALEKATEESLALAYNCLAQGLTVKPKLEQQLEQVLAADLASPNPGIAQLAAEVKLSRRLNQLFRIDNRIEIGLSYITCAEYQLFLDQTLAAGEHHQPDHWESKRFIALEGNQPITGIGASDAKAFCKWLTQNYSTPGFRYRLPTSDEAQEYPAIEQPVGCWCQEKEHNVIVGIKPAKWKNWQKQLANVVQLDIALDLNLDLEGELELFRYLDIQLYRYLELNLYQYRNLYQELEQNLDLDRYLYQNLEPYQDLYKDLKLGQYINLNPYLNLDLDRYENPDLKLLRFYVLLVFIAWSVRADIYKKAATNPQILKPVHLTVQNCQELSRKYASNRDKIAPIYTLFLLMDERRTGRMPAWEGIRVVREKVN
ncbi:NACHT domain-containing protein [Moorena producens JHB]|uniref:NACHT domain-containing protein n=1 Tax=Moorena producens (strain JHB) TaxID=1454205 RepID=A0A1D9FUE1_MOOP1|nr:NACHT domain-containing protein [Moorena producens]AOY78941.1 NACHT domain-containing protein [Moorena producens JHB]